MAVLMIGAGVMARLPAQPQNAPPKPNVQPNPPADPLPEGAVSRLGSPSFRHGGVRSLAFVGDGKSLLSVGFGYARLWDIETGKELHHLGGRDETADLVVSASVLADGKTAILFTRRQAATRVIFGCRVWDLVAWKELRRFDLTSRAGRTTALTVPACVSSDGRRMVELDSAGDVWLWDVSAGKADRRLDRSGPPLTAVAFMPDSLSVVTGNGGHTVRVWDTATGAERRSFGKAKDPLRCLAVSPDGKWLATAGDRVRLWDFAKGNVVRELAWVKQGKPAGGRIEEVVFTPDSKLVHAGGTFKGGHNHLLRLRWEVATGKGLGEADYGGFLAPPAYRADSQWVIEGTSFGYLLPFDLKNRDFKLPRDFAHWQVRSFAFAPDGKALLTADASDELRSYDLATGVTGKPRYADLGAMGTLTLSPDGRTALGGGNSPDETPTIRLLDPGTGKIRHTVLGTGVPFRRMASSWSRPARICACASSTPAPARSCGRLTDRTTATCSSRGIIKRWSRSARQCRYGASRTGRSGPRGKSAGR